MRKLHLVGLTTDRDGLIFTARKGSKSGGFIVPLDDKVLAAVAEARAANGSPADAELVGAEVEPVARRLRSQSLLTPREMQARLRGGRSIDEVAAEAGVDTEWVARFAVPILAEQAQVVELARALVYAKPRLGESAQPLGPSVAQNLSDRGVFLPDDVAAAAWSAYQLHDSIWMVRFRYRARGRDQEAHWEIDVPAGRLLARNRYASDLGYVDPGRRRRDVEADDEVPAGDIPVEAVPPARRRVSRAEPTAGAKRRTAARRPASRVAPPARRAPKAAKVAKPARKAGVAKATTKRTAKVPPLKAGAVKGKAATPRRRATKAAPAPDGGPTAGSGAVRMAVAQVSTARVAASMAAADREPWAAVVRRPAPPTNRSTSQADAGPRPAARRPPPPPPPPNERRLRPDEDKTVPPFQPRPLPAGGDTRAPEGVRRVTVPRPGRPSTSDGPPAMSIPAPRQPAPQQEPIPVERTKRRRLRSR